MNRILVKVIPTWDANADLQTLSNSLCALPFIDGVSIENSVTLDKKYGSRYNGVLYYNLGDILARTFETPKKGETVLMITNEPVIRDFYHTHGRIEIISGISWREEKKALVSSYNFSEINPTIVFHNIGGHELYHIVSKQELDHDNKEGRNCIMKVYDKLPSSYLKLCDECVSRLKI